MEVNIKNIPHALLYFFIGAFVNLMLYYILSPDQADLIGMLTSMSSTALDTGTINVIYFGVLIVGIMVNILYPLWTVFDMES